MKRLIICLAAVCSCGYNDKSARCITVEQPQQPPPPPVKPDPLAGRWDAYQQETAVFAKWIIIGEDHTFFLSGKRSGSVKVFGDKIEFIYAERSPQIFQFSVDEISLSLLYGNTQEKYIKVPQTERDFALSATPTPPPTPPTQPEGPPPPPVEDQIMPKIMPPFAP